MCISEKISTNKKRGKSECVDDWMEQISFLYASLQLFCRINQIFYLFLDTSFKKAAAILDIVSGSGV
jgi:hypothetical protein